MAEEIKQEIAEVEDDDKEFERINKKATDILSSFIKKSQDLSSDMQIILKRNFPPITNEDHQVVIAIKSIEINSKVIIKNLTNQQEFICKAYAEACKLNTVH
jgi:hypothetical protein